MRYRSSSWEAGGRLAALLDDADRAVTETRWRRWQTSGLLFGMARVLIPFLGLLFVAAVLTSLAQVGFLWVPERLAPDPNRLNPIQGLGRIFSLSGTMRLGFGLFKVLLIALVAAAALWLRRGEILAAANLETEVLGRFVADITLQTVLWLS